MKRPKRYLAGMAILSILGFFGTTSITIFSAGILSAAALVLIGVFITSAPMMFLLWRDITAIRRKGVQWGRSRWGFYILAILPAWVVSPIYYYKSREKIKNQGTSYRDAEILYEEISEEIPLSECSWTRDQIQNLSDDQFNNLIYVLAEAMEEEEGMNVKSLTDPTMTRFEFLMRGDGLTIFCTWKRDIANLIQDDPEEVAAFLDRSISIYDYNVDLGIVITDSEISEDEAVPILHNYNIFLSGIDDLRQDLEIADVSPDIQL